MDGGGRKTKAKRRKGRGSGAFGSSLMAFAVTLSLIFQLVAVAHRQARAESEPAAIAAELKATFGDAAALCVQVDDKGAPLAPTGSCDDHCPICRLSAGAGLPALPDAPALPIRLRAAGETVAVAAEHDRAPIYRSKQCCARAPPIIV